MKMTALLLFCAFIATGFILCAGQDYLTAEIHMSNAIGTARFTWNTNNLTVSISLSKQDVNFTSVEILPMWLDYDVPDKCSSVQLGTPKPGLAQGVFFSGGTATVIFQGVESLDSVEGNSLALVSPNKRVCASIEREGAHITAVAQFQGLVQGTLYFRQHISPNSLTCIISDLFSGQSSYTSSWWISSATDSCSQASSAAQSDVYNPNNVAGNGCSNTAQQQCRPGQLSDKLGNVTIAVNRGESRQSYTDRNLPLGGIDQRLLLIKTYNGTACAVIRVYSKRIASVEFSNDGITGSISFSQDSPFDPTQTMVNLKGLNSMAKGYHVHLWPTPTKIVTGQELCSATVVSGHFNPYNINASDSAYPSPASGTNDMYELGDLSSKYGTLANSLVKNDIYKDWNLPLFRRNSIIGRAFVIHRDDLAGSRWVCANIQPKDRAVVAVAVFKYPVIGHVFFMQEKNKSLSETSIFAQLDYNDGRPGTKNNKWEIHVNKAGSDMLSTDAATRCLSTGAINDPHNLEQQIGQAQYSTYCSKNSPFGCKLGDLSGKLGLLSIRNTASSDTSTRQFYTDVALHLSGPYSVIGKSLVIMDEQGTSILSCADIQPVHDPNLEAKISMGGLTGTVSFTQNAGIGAKKTTVTNTLTGKNPSYRLMIYELPPVVASSNPCSDIGNVYNPLNVTQNASNTATDDQYEVGDLSQRGIQTTWSRYNLPLTGLTSIAGRSLVVQDQNQNRLVACARIDISLPDGLSQNIEAVSTFKGAISGTFRLMQSLNGDGTMSDTSIIVELNNQNGSKSYNHNWHTHKSPIQGDADATQNQCNSADVHFDPYMTMIDKSNYPIECRPENPLRCELGDQAMKLSTYNVGTGRILFTDVDLPLAGSFSVLGKSMVLHVAEKGAPRLACADIIPQTNDFIVVKLKSPSALNKTDITEIYAAAINANLWDVVAEIFSESNEQAEIHVHFVGLQKEVNKQKFQNIVNGNNKKVLDPYSPISSSTYHVMSTVVLLFILAIHLLNVV